MAKRKTTRRKAQTKRKRTKKVKEVRGFEANARAIAKRQGISMEQARKILAAGARKASPAAKRRNPRLKRVKRRK